MKAQGNWGSYIQSGGWEHIDELGKRLSLVINCPVHYPAYNKRMFECSCGRCFALYLVESFDDATLISYHRGEV
jgi:hypothetical protein